jgi:ketosteroid isomerase-like protein
MLDEDIVWTISRSMPDAGTFQGREGVRESFARWSDAWKDVALDPQSFDEHGDEVFAVVRYSARGRTSDMPLDALVGHRWRLADGRMVEMTMFGNAERARERFLAR